MKTCLRLCTLFLAAALFIGCAHKGSETAVKATAEAVQANGLFETAALEKNDIRHDAKVGQKLVKKAKTAIGTPYVLGGTEPGGFDCSGLVKWTYNSIGVELPRTAREQSAIGKKINNIEDMRAGDIVAFRHPKRGYHTGIYVGDGKFIHSPRKRTRVRINSLTEPYFSSTLLGARRVAISGSSNIVAEAETRLEEFISQRSRLKISTENLAAHKAAKPQQKADKQKQAVKPGKQAKADNAVKSSKSAKAAAAKKNVKHSPAAKVEKNAKNAKKSMAHNSKNNSKAAGNVKNKSSKKQVKTVAAKDVKNNAKAKNASARAVSMLQNKKAKPRQNSRRHS